MSSSTCNEQGMGLVEVLIAFFLLSFGILALVSLQPPAWRSSAKSDFVGRAAGILHSELEANEGLIVNPCNPNPCAGANPVTATRNVYVSGQGTPQPGDMAFTVQTTIEDNGNGSWRVTVRVIWAGNNTDITESRLVTRQEHFRFPKGCV